MSFFQKLRNITIHIINVCQIQLTNIIFDLFWKYNYVMIQIEDSKIGRFWKPTPTKLIEPMFDSWICIASIESGHLLEKYIYADYDYNPELDGNSVLICKIDDTIRVKISQEDAISGPSRVSFLSVLYEHPDMPRSLRLVIDPRYMLIGNCLLNRIFVLRLLRYQYNTAEFVFDDRYHLTIMDSNINIYKVHPNQGIILGKNTFIITPP